MTHATVEQRRTIHFDFLAIHPGCGSNRYIEYLEDRVVRAEAEAEAKQRCIERLEREDER